MSPDERSARVQTEVCPFCGKPFKRLKSHIAHCKMAPVSHGTKTPKASKMLDHTPPEKNTPKKKKTKVMEKQWGVSGSSLTDTQSGPALKTKETGLRERPVAAKVSQNKKTSKPIDTNIKGKVFKNVGLETVKPKREQEPGGKQQYVKQTGPVSSRPGGKRPADSALAGDHSTHTTMEKGPVAENRSSPKKGQLESKPPKDKGRRSLLQSISSSTGGAGAQEALPSSRTAQTKAREGTEGAMETRPHGRISFWEDLSGWPRMESPDGDGLQSGRAERSCSVGQAWTKSSVWDHIKEGFSGRSAAHLLTADRSEATLTAAKPVGLSALPAENASPQDKAWAESRCESAVGVGSGRLMESQPLQAFLPLLPQDHAHSHIQAHAPKVLHVEGLSTRHSARGLEWTGELAAGYRGIGLSMLPLRPLTERVQRKAPPTQRLATGSQGSVTERRLMEMKLKELPDWLTSQRLLTPRGAVAAVQRGWLRYYRKYIDVRRGGVSGIGMLIAGYCVLSYIWSYPHLKQERWRKYH